MKIHSKNFSSLISLIFIIAILSSCAPSARYADTATETSYSLRDDKALVIFIGCNAPSEIFDISDGNDKVIASLGSREKAAYYSDPGKRQFMVIGENADFMDASLLAGKVYYAKVVLRMGVWKVRFSIYPFKQLAHEKEYQLDSPELVKMLNESKYMTINDEAYLWANNNAPSISGKRVRYLKKWAEMPDEVKRWRTLLPEDGLNEPL